MPLVNLIVKKFEDAGIAKNDLLDVALVDYEKALNTYVSREDMKFSNMLVNV